MIIRLRDITLTAYHGVLPSEKEQGNTFRVSLAVTVPDTPGIDTDCLVDTINYQELYDIVVREMAVPANLLEHVAGRIRLAIQQNLPQATSISITVAKKNPPLGGKVEWAEVEI